MKKVSLLVGLVAAFALLGVSYISYAQDHTAIQPGDDDPLIAPSPDQEIWPPMGRGAGIAEELNLTKDQIDKLESLKFEGRKEGIELYSKLKIAQLEMAELMKTQGNDEAVINKSHEIANLQSEAMDMRIRHQLAMRAVFTKEQWDKISTLRNMAGRGRHFRGQPGMMQRPRGMREDGMRRDFRGNRPDLRNSGKRQ